MTAAFFKLELIPTGQVLQLVAAALTFGPSSSKDRKQAVVVIHDVWDALNLTSAAIIIDPARANDAAIYVSKLRAILIDYLRESVGKTNFPKLAKALLTGTRPTVTAVGSNLAARLTMNTRLFSMNPLQKHIDALHKLIGYSSSSRQAWVSQVKSSPSPLFKNGSINKWRTFVRNSSWLACAQELLPDGRKHLGVDDVSVFYSSQAGIAAAKELWESTFEKAPMQTQITDRVPVGVSVASTTAGQLIISAVFDPTALLKEEHRKVLKEEALVKKVSFSEIACMASFSDTVNKADAWLTAQRSKKSELEERAEQLLQAQKILKIKEKIAKSFTDEERKLLSKVLSEL